ncbi:MAG: sel1 repeat family protein [Opitutae bacterium]|nr:sel1 repeat family protein [Opitutae bacterium]
MLSLFATGAVRAETAYQWPDAPPAVLREELFGIRFRLVLGDKGPAKAAQFLRDEMRKRPDAPEVRAYVAWVSLFPKGWGLGEIVPNETCESLLRMAARDGSLVAKDVLGYALVHGQLGLGEDRAEGLRLLREAAGAGFARSIGRLGHMKVQGWGVPANPVEGVFDLQRAVALGSTMDLADVAEAFERQVSPIGIKHWGPGRALEYYYLLALENDGLGWKKLAEFEQKGVPDAKLMRSLAYVRFANEGGFIVPSVVRQHLAVLESAGQNDGRACVELGVAKLFGVDWIKRDPAGAKEYFTRALRQGNQEAKFFLAYMRLRGLAGPQEKDAALAEMTAMADAGNVRACSRLGFFYYWGTSEAGKLKEDPAKAFHYTRKAAELGSKLAIMNLAHCYKHGIGTKENPVLAAKLYWRATDYGYYGAKEDLVRQLAFAKVP